MIYCYAMETSTGIILKHYAPQRQVVCVLDQSLGRIQGIVVHNIFSVGTILSYTLTKTHHGYFMQEIDIIAMPFVGNLADMLFFHHIFELCYHVIPEGIAVDRIYNLILFLFSKAVFSNIQKKKIICVLYALLGLYVDDESLYAHYMYRLEQVSLVDMIDEEVDVMIEKNISRWLYQCIRAHIDVRKLKTVHFLDEI